MSSFTRTNANSSRAGTNSNRPPRGLGAGNEGGPNQRRPRGRPNYNYRQSDEIMETDNSVTNIHSTNMTENRYPRVGTRGGPYLRGMDNALRFWQRPGSTEILRKELLGRFTNMLPTLSFLESEAVCDEGKKSNSETKPMLTMNDWSLIPRNSTLQTTDFSHEMDSENSTNSDDFRKRKSSNNAKASYKRENDNVKGNDYVNTNNNMSEKTDNRPVGYPSSNIELRSRMNALKSKASPKVMRKVTKESYKRENDNVKGNDYVNTNNNMSEKTDNRFVGLPSSNIELRSRMKALKSKASPKVMRKVTKESYKRENDNVKGNDYVNTNNNMSEKTDNRFVGLPSSNIELRSRMKALKSKASPKVMRKVTKEERIAIMNQHGFDTNVLNRPSSSNGGISHRATPRIRHNLTELNKDLSVGSSEHNHGDYVKRENVKSKNALLKETGFTGGKQLNINRPVRDSNERVPTRAEALNRIEERYEVERAIHEEKKREKEAKKREEYLARYKHVDQGHRLNDGLLDEAAGYAVDYKPKESLEEVRKRQQNHFNNIALVFQEEQRKIGEQQKLLDAEKALKKLEEYSQNIDVGYRLGRGDGTRPAPNYLTAETSKNEHAKPKERVGTNSSSSKQQQKNNLTENKLPESVIQREQKDQKHNMTQEHLDQNSHCLEKSVKKSENNNIPVHQETGFEVDKDNNLAVGYNPNETFEEVLKRQHEQLKNFALEGRESYNLEEKGVENLENNIDCEIGFELDPDDNSDEQRCVRQVLEVLDDDEDLPNNERPDLQAPISPELMLEGETEEEFLQRQEEQLIIEAMLLSQIEFETKQTEKLQKNSAPSTPGQEIKKEEKRECTGCIKVREAKVLQTIVSEEKTQIQNFEPATRQADTTKGAISKNKVTFPNVTEKNENDTKIHNNEKSVNDGAVQNRDAGREAHSQLNMSKLLDKIEESASTNNVSQANTVPQQIPGESSKPSGVEPASCVLRNKNGAVLVLRPTPQQLNQALAQKLEVQEEMDKQGSSIHYKPTPEQVPLYYNNRFDINQRCDVANQTSAVLVLKKDSRLADVPATVKSAGAPSNGENIKEDTPYDHQAELRAARLRFQKKYEETLKKLQGEKNNQ